MLKQTRVCTLFSIPRVFISSLFWLLLLAIPAHASAENNINRKAEIIKQLTSIVSWPASVLQGNNFNICILGKLDDLKPLTELNGQIVNRRKLIVKNINAANEAKKDCQLLYVTETESKNAKQIIHLLNGEPILLISDIANFARDGGSMNFMMLNEALAISVNLVSIKNSKLNIDLKAYDEITILPETSDLKD